MTIKVEVAPRAQKDLERIPAHIRRKVLSWIDSVEFSGLEVVRKISGYHDEPLKGTRSDQRSIRLNRFYRAVYEVIYGNPILVQIQEVTKHGY